MTTISITTVYGDDADYVDVDSRDAIEGLPATAWSALLEALDKISAGATEPGIDCIVAKTHETLDDFDASRLTHWSEQGTREEHVCGGLRAVSYEGYQIHKGHPRQHQIVIDCGDCRAVLVV